MLLECVGALEERRELGFVLFESVIFLSKGLLSLGGVCLLVERRGLVLFNIFDILIVYGLPFCVFLLECSLFLFELIYGGIVPEDILPCNKTPISRCDRGPNRIGSNPSYGGSNDLILKGWGGTGDPGIHPRRTSTPYRSDCGACGRGSSPDDLGMSLDELAGPALDCCRGVRDGLGNGLHCPASIPPDALHDRRMGTGDLLGSLLH